MEIVDEHKIVARVRGSERVLYYIGNLEESGVYCCGINTAGGFANDNTINDYLRNNKNPENLLDIVALHVGCERTEINPFMAATNQKQQGAAKLLKLQGFKEMKSFISKSSMNIITIWWLDR